MRLLLDTHTLIWWWNDDPKLPESLRPVLGDRQHEVFVSAVAGWEIANKVRLGKLPEMDEHIGSYDALVTGDGFSHLAIEHDHATAAGLLPGGHRDPFDRMLAAQALAQRLTVVTGDPAFRAFGCEVIW